MKRQLIGKIVFAMAALVAGTTGARADVLKLTGASFDVYYESSYWSGATLVGDSLSLGKTIEFIGAPGNANYTEFGSVLSVVAHAGYALTGDMLVGVSGSYTLPGYLNGPYGPTGGAGIQAGALVFGGDQPSAYLGSASAGVFVDSTPEASAGTFGPSGPTFSMITTALYQQLALQPILDLQAYPRLTTATITGVSYEFAVASVTPVPEPESYLMLLGGLVLLARRLRKRTC